MNTMHEPAGGIAVLEAQTPPEENVFEIDASRVREPGQKILPSTPAQGGLRYMQAHGRLADIQFFSDR